MAVFPANLFVETPHCGKHFDSNIQYPQFMQELPDLLDPNDQALRRKILMLIVYP